MSSDKTPFFKQGDPLFRYITETQGDEVYPPESPAAYKPGARHLSDVELAPMLHRSRTFCDYLKPNRDLVVPISVNNPMQANRRLSVVPGNDFDRLIERVGSLKSLRPFKLIGKMGKRVDWGSYKVDADSKLIKNSKVREFYKEQNELIECYEDIDLLLDTGVQFDMVQSYADNTSSNTSEEDSDSGLENENPIEVDVKSERLTLPITSLKMMKKSSNGTTNSSGRKHINISAVPGNIDIEGAKILGYGDHPSSNVVLYAIYFNFVLNVILLVGKIVAVYLSDSMSLIASLVDSSLDFLSTMIIFISNKYAAKQSTKFPVGRKQLEPIGVLVFSVLMILSFSQVLIESIKELVDLGSPHEVTRISMTAIIIMVSTITSKIVAYLLCKSVKNSSVQALVEDAKTDIVFNIFSLLFPVLSLVLRVWWIDSLGASLLCIYVISQWAAITFEHIDHLSGSHASKKNYQQVLYMAARFSEEIEGIKNYRMYHVGDLVNVEVDIVLRNSKMSLKDCHDLGESLQYAIETLPYVNRCFVHIDYKIRNYLGHIS